MSPPVASSTGLAMLPSLGTDQAGAASFIEGEGRILFPVLC